MITFLLLIQCGGCRESIIGNIRKIFTPDIRDDQAVELTVILQAASTVNTDNLPLPVDDRIGVFYLFTILHDRPVAYDQPAVKASIRL